MSILPDLIEIPLSGPVTGSIRIPGSKSISNRALLIAALAEGDTEVLGLLESDDVIRMYECLTQLGLNLGSRDDFFGSNPYVMGCNGEFKPTDQALYVENAGTAARFLTAALTLGKGTYVLDGNERMRQRPLDDLIDALEQVDVEISAPTGCPPVTINAKGFPGGHIEIPGDKSSQYISALMIVAPYAKQDTTIEITGEMVSKTYIEMTQKIMADFEVDINWNGGNWMQIPSGQSYKGKGFYNIEGDASSGSYYFALPAIAGGSLKIEGIPKESTQGDLGLIQLLEKMGCTLNWIHPHAPSVTNTPIQHTSVKMESSSISGPNPQVEIQAPQDHLKAITADMNTMSDVAPTLAVVALFAEGTTQITNVGNMRIKECDRLFAVYTELKKLGAQVWPMKGEEILRDHELQEIQKGQDIGDLPDGLAIQGDPSAKSYHGAELDTYDDHRLAMCLSLAGTRIKGVKIKDPACVSKTFPTYWQELKKFLPDLVIEA